uniref:F-box domain-containing protein n=1 Tax=Ditylenchus dipsaci TaxID=166011 RepID=A0A915CRF2_9BILA
MTISSNDQFYQIFSYFSRKELILLQTVNHTVNDFIQHFFQNHPPYICLKYVYLDAFGDCYTNGRNEVKNGRKVCIYGHITGPSRGPLLIPGWTGSPIITPTNLTVPGTDICWRRKFHKLHPLLLSKFLRVKQTDIVFLEPASTKSSRQFISKILQLSHLWEGQRLEVTMYYVDLPAELLPVFALAKVLVIQLNLHRKEWYTHKICERNVGEYRPLIPSASLLDFYQLQQCQRLIVPVYGTIEVNIEDLVDYLNSKPLPNNQSRELCLLVGACTNLDIDKLFKLLVQKFMSAASCCSYAFLFGGGKLEPKLSPANNSRTKEKLEMHILNAPSIYYPTEPCFWHILTRAGISDHGAFYFFQNSR